MPERLHVGSEQKFFAGYVPEEFTPDEERILSLFFSNTDKPVFVVSGLPPVLLGALIGRHSQANGSMRRVFLDEFVSDWSAALNVAERPAINSAFLDMDKAVGLMQKHFVGFGHDSLAATVPVVVGFEGVSQLGAKGIERARIGIAPIERSTRYGYFGARGASGKYQYTRSPEIMGSKFARLYEVQIDANLDLYSRLQGPVIDAYRRKYPTASESRIQRMTFDTTRVLLVAANLTNLGAVLNAQSAESLILRLRASCLLEHQELGLMIQEEIARADPVLVQRIETAYGQSAINYYAQQRENESDLAGYLIEEKAENLPQGVYLVAYDKEGEDKVIAWILWEGGSRFGATFEQTLNFVKELPPVHKEEIIGRYIAQRPDLRTKPGRPFEEAGLTFEIVCRFAEWRDLQRHRILTPHWRNLDCRLGFDIGEDLVEFGFGQVVRDRLEEIGEAQMRIAKDFPNEAQYLVPFGALMPYGVTLNIRELIHIAELRTTAGAHPDYARIAREMARLAKEAYPLLGQAFKFVR